MEYQLWLYVCIYANRTDSSFVSLVQYYDWENNKCHPLSLALDDNVEIEEKDIVIPAELDPSQNSKFPDFEPKQIKKMVHKLN